MQMKPIDMLKKKFDVPHFDHLQKKIDFRVFPFFFASSAPLAVVCSGMYEQWSFTDTRALVASQVL